MTDQISDIDPKCISIFIDRHWYLLISISVNATKELWHLLTSYIRIMHTKDCPSYGHFDIESVPDPVIRHWLALIIDPACPDINVTGADQN